MMFMIFDSEEDLIIAMKKHDQDALKEVIDQYGKLILYIIHKSLSTPIEKQYVDDCYNDVFTIIWFNIEQFDIEKGNLKSWMIGITKLKALEYKKKVYKENKIDKDVEIETGIHDKYEIEQEEEIMEIVQDLNTKDRYIFLKRYIDGYSIDDIAKELKVTADYIYNRISRGKGVCNLDKRLLSMLNELQYSEEEITRLEKEANESINIDKYYVRNGGLFKKTLQMLEESIRNELQAGEEIEKELLVDEGYMANNKVIPNIYYVGATFYYYIVLTNKRVIMKGLDCYFKKTNEHSMPIEDIQSISQHKKMKNVFEIKYNNTHIQFGSIEYAREVAMIVMELKKRGVKVEKYTDFEKGFFLFFNIFVIVSAGLCFIKYLM
ncbi:RNA polymerase, sigma-24 subunit, ECF subfamily [Bacillus mycoides]|uniref:RNA polymerase, sigma-24 subunit, ECF subfamily n=2 Tax=Bacillus cereus group TaxID=86661 RepID=C2XRZ6_BACMY|nr:RNA polymerase, sigma-24 subunit, ECF subfamily [Bacillus mycoides]